MILISISVSRRHGFVHHKIAISSLDFNSNTNFKRVRDIRIYTQLLQLAVDGDGFGLICVSALLRSSHNF